MQRLLQSRCGGRRVQRRTAETLEPRRLLAGVAQDMTFGVGGHAVVDLSPTSISEDYVLDAAVAPGGKIILVGSSDQGPRQWAVTRYNANGSVDTTFGQAGTTLFQRGVSAIAMAAEVQPDGKAVVSGYSYETFGTSTHFNSAVVIRYNLDGSLDQSFGAGGVVVPSGAGSIFTMALLPDGKILAGGRMGDDGWSAFATLWRFNPDGSPDTTFGTNGRITYDQNFYSQTIDIFDVFPDGRFVAGTRGNAAITVFRADGTIESAFGGPTATYADVVRQPDGKFVGLTDLNAHSVQLKRFDAAGQPDLSFGTAGSAVFEMDTTLAAARDLALLPDGKILAAADGRLESTREDIGIARFNPDGTPDFDFGAAGRIFESSQASLSSGVFSGYDDFVLRLLPTPDGKLFVAGSTDLFAPEDAGISGTRRNQLLLKYVLDPPINVNGGGPYGPVNEGQVFSVSGAGSTYANGSITKYEWDSNFAGHLFVPEAQGVTANVAIPDDRAPTTLVLRVTTSDGLQAISRPIAVDVRNVAPTIQPTQFGAFVYGVSGLIKLPITDPGADTYSGQVNFGDNSTPGSYSVVTRNAQITHTYAAPGTYTVNATVADDDGGTGSGSGSVVVTQIGGSVANDDGQPVGFHGSAYGPGVTVYVDLDSDGQFDAGEPSGVTDANGTYGINGLQPGAYRVRIVPPSGTLPSSPDEGFADVTITATKGVIKTFGLTTVSRINGFVFFDDDSDGVHDPAEGGAMLFSQFVDQGFSAYLDINHNGIADPNEPSSSANPATPGTFVFRGVQPGEYDVRLNLPVASRYRQTAPANGAPIHVTVSGPGQAVTLAAEFGVDDATPVIAGRVFDDLSGNGTRDGIPQEPTLPRVTLFDDVNNNSALDDGEQTKVTDLIGAYRFEDLPPGFHSIRVVPPPGWVLTTFPWYNTDIDSTTKVLDAGLFGMRHSTDRTLPTATGMTRLPGIDGLGRHLVSVSFSEALSSPELIQIRVGTAWFSADATFVSYDDASHAATFALPSNLASGFNELSVLAPSVFDAVGNPMLVNAYFALNVDAVAPRVTDVFVSGNTWASGFRTLLQNTGVGESAFGFRIPAAAQTDELPWANVNQISIRFNENVNVAADDLVVRGVTSSTYEPAATNAFSYDPVTFTATWTLATAGVANDKLLLDLDADLGAGVTDLAGNALDGEWMNPLAPAISGGGNFPSGDGTPGGDFRFRLNVLPGDVNRSGGPVLGSDVTLVRNAQNFSPGTSGYSMFYDVNASASILGSDVTLVRNRQGMSLPAGEPIAPQPLRITAPVLRREPPRPVILNSAMVPSKQGLGVQILGVALVQPVPAQVIDAKRR